MLSKSPLGLNKRSRQVALVAFSSLAAHLALAEEQTERLPSFTVESTRVANDEPAGTMVTPVSALRYEPRADVQARNFAEAQADVAVRGGVFEQTGVRVGSAALTDPQTGHYFFELPVSAEMLSAPVLATGIDLALGGFNAGAGAVRYEWAPIRSGGRLSLAGGENDYHRESAYLADARDVAQRGTLGVDVAATRSQSDGAIAYGDHDFSRLNGRIQWRTTRSQTDLFAGYQHKYFGWPNLYTPFGFNETENLQTVLLLLNHAWRDDRGNEFTASAFYRRNKDDYEFNRAVPGASNPFQHTTWLRGVALAGRSSLAGGAALRYSLDAQSDHLESTALTFGKYNSRTLAKAVLAPEYVTNAAGGTLTSRAGVAFDDSNRDASAWSPLASLAWQGADQRQIRLEYSESTQLPTYTALNSNPSAGLFRGNANLERARSRNLELATAAHVRDWQLEAAVFRRWDDRLVDWTYRRGVTARTANPVDTVTDGIELFASRRSERIDLTFGYAWLAKSSSYGSAAVDASFYALNFPEHRATAAVRWRLGGGFELRVDNEYRVQSPNFLRTAGGEHALLTSAALYYAPPRWRGWECSVVFDNVWDSDFQEVPAVPATPRQWALSVAKRW